MSQLSPNNPIVLFGNIGPDVVRMSQIYDPDNDQFTKTNDDHVVVGKTYYRRTYASRVISYSEVVDMSTIVNPLEAGLYENNEDHEDVKGKYVPAVNSLVVCDEAYENYSARTILIVASVDDETVNPDNPTFKCTFVPINTGTEAESSTRVIDYGNDRFMLYFEKVDGDNVRIAPDRKLMMYGKRLYSYRLIKNNDVISAPSEILTGSTNDALIPYSGMDALSDVTLTKDNYGDYSGMCFTALVGDNYRSITVPSVPEPGDTVYVNTFDLVYSSSKNYFKQSVDHSGRVTYTKLTLGIDYRTGDTVGSTRTSGSVGYSKIFNTLNQVFNTGITGSVIKPSDSLVHYPEKCFLRSGRTLVSGETVTMEVFEYEGSVHRLVLSVTLIVKPGTLVNATLAGSKQVSGFDVEAFSASGDRVEEELDHAWRLPVGDNVADWEFRPTLKFTDGTKLVVPIDNRQSFVYGLENVKSGNANVEFRLLFKYFITPENGNDSNTAKRFATVTKTIRVTNSAANTIRKVSVLPVWDNSKGKYVFKFLVYRTDYSEPSIVDDLHLYDTNKNAEFASVLYKDVNGYIRTASVKSLGENFGFYQHAILNLNVSVNGYSTSVYSQNLALRVQNWLTETIPTKWLIGSFGTLTNPDYEYTKEETPYGNTSTDVRPYVEYRNDRAGFRIGSGPNGTYFNNKANFLRTFLDNALVDPSGDHTTVIVPDYFRIRTFMNAKLYDNLSETYALKNVKYYTDSDILVPNVVVGKTDVSRYRVKVQDNLRYFTKEDSVYVERTDLVVGDIISDDIRAVTYVLREEEIKTDFIPVDDYTRRITWRDLGGIEWTADSEYNADRTTGGFIPVVVTNDDGLRSYNTQVMGTVVIEFAKLEGSQYKYIYGVPVEVRHPYQFCTDTEYKSSKEYYTYDESSNTFTKETGYSVGDTIPVIGKQRYEKLYP